MINFKQKGEPLQVFFSVLWYYCTNLIEKLSFGLQESESFAAIDIFEELRYASNFLS